MKRTTLIRLALACCLIVVGCNSNGQVFQEPPNVLESPALMRPTAGSTPVTLGTSTPEAPLPHVEIIPITGMNSDLWSVRRLLGDDENSAPIVKSNTGYKLDQNWEVARIEYVYQGWGQRDLPFDHQSIESIDGRFVRGDEVLSVETIREFLASINNLHLTSMLVAGNLQTHNHPVWLIEITGQDGKRIILHSSSSGTIGSGPWNVYHAGVYFAQYDETIGDAISTIFPSEVGQPNNPRFSQSIDPEFFSFADDGRLNQDEFGFTGLLPISNGFSYEIQDEGEALVGWIRSANAILGLGPLVDGDVSRLTGARLVVDDLETACVILEIQNKGELSEKWGFSCTADFTQNSESLVLPIELIFETAHGDHVVLSGELDIDRFRKPYEELRLSTELLSAMETEDSFQKVIETHVLQHSYFVGRIPVGGNPSDGVYMGQMVFLGQALVDGESVRYTVTTPYAIQVGQFTIWGLNETIIKENLARIIQSPITRRILSNVPGTIINLYYFDDIPEFPIPMRSILNARYMDFDIRLHPCGSSLSGGIYPSDESPLIAFSFNHWPWFYQRNAEFMILEDKVSVAEIAVYLGDGWRDEIERLLIPVELSNQDFPISGIP